MSGLRKSDHPERHKIALMRRAAGAPEITPAMLKAGVDTICEVWGICGADLAPDLARDVFLAMCAQKDELHPDAWVRFERAAGVVAKSPPLRAGPTELERYRLRVQQHREHIRAMGWTRFHLILLCHQLAALLMSAALYLGRIPSPEVDKS